MSAHVKPPIANALRLSAAPAKDSALRAAPGPRLQISRSPASAKALVRAGRKHSGSPRSEDLPSIALNTQRALLRNQSSTLAKFPTNSLLLVENSLLGIQKFPAPLRREFGCKPMDSLAEWRRKL